MPASIDLNPVRAGIVKRPEAYRWSSLGYHVQSQNADGFLSMDFGLREFGIMDGRQRLAAYDYGGHSTVTGKKKREWQDDEFVLGFFGKKVSEARRNYRTYVEKDIELGRRPELVGGGLIRSLGGWDEVKKMRLTSHDRIKSDQRILGESDFVLSVLSESEEKFERKYRLRSLGYDYEKILERVSSIFDLEKDYITGKERQKERVVSRDVLCYWCVLELGIPMANLAKRLGLTISAESYAVQRGERIVKKKGFQLGS